MGQGIYSNSTQTLKIGSKSNAALKTWTTPEKFKFGSLQGSRAFLAPCSNVTATPATVFTTVCRSFFTAKFIGRKNLEIRVSFCPIQITPRTSTDMNWTIAQTTKYIGYPNQEELRRQFLTPLIRTGESMTSTRIGIQCCVFRANGDC